MNQLPKKQLKRNIIISKEEMERLRRYLEHEPASEKECLSEDETVTYTADFGNGMEMDVKVCGVQYIEGGNNTAWSEAVLFENGSEVCCTEPDEALEGEWRLIYEGTEYVADVMSTP